MYINLIELHSFSRQHNIFIIMLVHNTCNHSHGYVEIDKVKCNINVIISSHHASIINYNK